MQNVAFDDLSPVDSRQINLKLLAEELYEFLHFLAWSKLLILLNFDELDVELWEDNLTDVKIKLVFDKHVEVVDVTRIVCVNSDGLKHAI